MICRLLAVLVFVSFGSICPKDTLAAESSPSLLLLPPARATSTLLDPSGEFRQSVDPQAVVQWQAALHGAKTASGDIPRAGWLHLWLGEYALVHNEQPEAARRQFHQAQLLSTPRNPLYGYAAYDTAFSYYRQGAYDEAATAFYTLLTKGGSTGQDRRTCALLYRQAAVCYGWHQDHAARGIPEPPRLDPECGIAALASSLESIGLPYDRARLLSACRVTGLGSSLNDLVDAGGKLGVHVRAVTADEAGLQMLPKPLIAFVENDHFVSVVKADPSGVSYLCSDCGKWPGGRVDLTWTQWRLLNGGVYGVVTSPGDTWDRYFASLKQNLPISTPSGILTTLAVLRQMAQPAGRFTLATFRPGHVV